MGLLALVQGVARAGIPLTWPPLATSLMFPIVKPANIKVRAGTVKVLDFGLAKAMESPSAPPVSGLSAGTAAGQFRFMRQRSISRPS